MVNEVKLTTQQTKLLKIIMDDKYAVGPFCGMITNICEDKATNKVIHTIPMIIKNALNVRLECLRLSELQTETVADAARAGKIKKEETAVDIGL